MEIDLSTIMMETVEKMEGFPILHRFKGETFHKKFSYRQQRRDQSNNSAFRRSDNQPTTGFTLYEQKIPQKKNQTSSNMFRLTTTDETINELSDLYPINY